MRKLSRIAIVCWLTATMTVNPVWAHGGGGHGGGGGHMGGGHMGGGHMGGGHISGGHYGGAPVHHYSGNSYYPSSGHVITTHPGMNSTVIHHSGQTIQGNHINTMHHGITSQHFTGHHVNVGNHSVQLSHASYQPAYYRHGTYYHGHWNGHHHGGGYYPYYGLGWGAGFGYGFGYYPYFWGLGGWGLGSLIYNSGYCGYYNPYYNSAYGGYNYGQPIPVNYNQSNQSAQYSRHPADAILDTTIGLFRQNDFEGALAQINQGIDQYPDDAVLHEMRSLILFAKGDYGPSAATIHSVLAVGPGWDWTTMNGIYSNVGIYTNQLRALEAYVGQHLDDGSARFLLAYHYMTCGYPDAAARQLTKVVELVPNDQVAAALLRLTSAKQTTAPATGSNANVPQPVPEPPSVGQTPSPIAVTQLDPATITGEWKAARNDGSSFALRLGADRTFTWSFTPKDQPVVTFSGTYTLQGNVVALERTGGGSMVAQITGNDGSKFNFKMVGAPAEDPGLNFAK